MADVSSPDTNSGDKKISRRDFLKVAGVGLGALAVGPKLVEIGDSLEKEAVLMGARQFLIKNEDIPPGVENVPSENEHFMFADEILEKSLSQYEEWALKDNLPPPFFRKSESYFDYTDAKDLVAIGRYGVDQYSSFLRDVFSKENKYESVNDFLTKYKDIWESEIAYVGTFLTDYTRKKGKFGSKPIYFSNEILNGPDSYLLYNPGSAISNRVCSTLEIKNEDDVEKRKGEVGAALHKEIDPIWNWVKDYVAKIGKPMTSDVFLAGLLYINSGDITGSLWDKVVLEKLISRSDPKTFEFNFDITWKENPNYDQYIKSIKDNQDNFLGMVQDNFAPRLSANYINKNVRRDELFAYNHFEDVYEDGHNYKPFDSYCATGNIYHGSNDMALATITSPELLQLMILYKDFYNSTVGPNPDYGLEKITADLLVAYHAPEVRKILNKYAV